MRVYWQSWPSHWRGTSPSVDPWRPCPGQMEPESSEYHSFAGVLRCSSPCHTFSSHRYFILLLVYCYALLLATPSLHTGTSFFCWCIAMLFSLPHLLNTQVLHSFAGLLLCYSPCHTFSSIKYFITLIFQIFMFLSLKIKTYCFAEILFTFFLVCLCFSKKILKKFQ